MAQQQARPEQTWIEIVNEFAKIGVTVVLLAFVGLVLALGLVWGFSSVFGEGLSKYPWHVVLWIDFAFVLIAAVLSEIAEAPSEKEARSWALASFAIAVGTLGSLGSHAGKILRSIIDTGQVALEDPTILSQMLVTHFGQASGARIYFALTLTIILFSLLLALGSAIVLRESDENRAYFVFIVSAFLFALNTILNQKWDVSGPHLPPLTWWHFLFLGLAASILLGSFFLVGEAANATRQAVRSIDRHLNPARSPTRSTATSSEAPKWIRAAILSLSAIPRWALLIFLISGIVFLRTVEQPDSDLARRVFDMLVWFTYLALIFLILSLLPDLINVFVAVISRLKRGEKQSGEDLSPPVEQGPDAGQDRVSPPPPPPPRWDWLKRAFDWIKNLWRDERGKPSPQPVEEQRRDEGQDAATSPPLPRWDWLKRALASGGVAVSVVLTLLLVHYVATLPVPPPPPFSATQGKQALRPLEGTAGKERMPPPQFSRASIDCALRQPPAWARSEVDGLHGSIESCRFAIDPSCVPSTIVVAGTASLPGLPADEIERARIRGQNLARVLEQDLRIRCGERTRVKSYVLNLGRYSRGPLLGEEVRQREVIVLFSRGDDDASKVSLALQKYASTEPQLAQYLACEFHTTAKGAARVSLLGKLDCGNR